MGNPTTTTTDLTTADLRDMVADTIVERTERIAAAKARIAILREVARDAAALAPLSHQLEGIEAGVATAIEALDSMVDGLIKDRACLGRALGELD